MRDGRRDSAMHTREFVFGDTPYAVVIRPRGDGAVDTVFVIEDDGARRPLTTIEGHDPDQALALAAVELERRFGRLTKTPVPADGACASGEMIACRGKLVSVRRWFRRWLFWFRLVPLDGHGIEPVRLPCSTKGSWPVCASWQLARYCCGSLA